MSEYFFFKSFPPKIVIFLQGIPQAFFLNSYPSRLFPRNCLNSRHSSRYIFWIIFQGHPPRYFLLFQGLLWHNIALASTFWIYYRIYFYFMFVCDDRTFNIRGFGQILKLDAQQELDPESWFCATTTTKTHALCLNIIDPRSIFYIRPTSIHFRTESCWPHSTTAETCLKPWLQGMYNACLYACIYVCWMYVCIKSSAQSLSDQPLLSNINRKGKGYNSQLSGGCIGVRCEVAFTPDFQAPKPCQMMDFNIILVPWALFMSLWRSKFPI